MVSAMCAVCGTETSTLRVVRRASGEELTLGAACSDACVSALDSKLDYYGFDGMKRILEAGSR